MIKQASNHLLPTASAAVFLGLLFCLVAPLPLVAAPSFPIKVSQTDTEQTLPKAGKKFVVKTEATISSNGRLEALIDIQNKFKWDGVCIWATFFFLDKDKKIIHEVGIGSQLCVGSVLGHKVGIGKKRLDSKPTRKQTFSADIRQDVLGRTESISILHKSGGKDPTVLLREGGPKAAKLIKDIVQIAKLIQQL